MPVLELDTLPNYDDISNAENGLVTGVGSADTAYKRGIGMYVRFETDLYLLIE